MIPIDTATIDELVTLRANARLESGARGGER